MTLNAVQITGFSRPQFPDSGSCPMTELKSSIFCGCRKVKEAQSNSPAIVFVRTLHLPLVIGWRSVNVLRMTLMMQIRFLELNSFSAYADPKSSLQK